MGNAVDCPTIKAYDGKVYDGKVYPVSHLPAGLRIGDRVTVTGYFAHVTHCRGRVLYVTKASHP